jgi:hypothetical protein
MTHGLLSVSFQNVYQKKKYTYVCFERTRHAAKNIKL